MSGLTFDADSSPSLPDKPLGATDVGPNLVGGTVGYEAEPQLTGIKFGLGVQGNASLTVFNSADDVDSDGVLGLPIEQETGFGTLSLPPQILFGGDGAWLKFRYSAKAKVQPGGTISPGIQFKVDGSKEVIFADYHVHSGSENTRTALLADARALRFAANVNDVFELKDREALLYQTRGELAASITLSWSDVFSSTLAGLSAFVKSGRLLAVEIAPTASVTFHVGLVDDFRLIFTRGDGDLVRVAVKKSSSREAGANASLGVVAKFANEDDIAEALTKLLEAVSGQAIADVEKVLSQANLESLPSPLDRIAKALIERLGFGDVVSTIDALKTRWEALKSKIEAMIRKVAAAKVEAAFTYEYLRISTETTLLVANVERDIFKQVHNELLLCDLRDLLSRLEGNPGAIETYLNEKTTKRTQAWGFTLGIGSWKLSGKDKKELIRVTQRNFAGQERIAFGGLRGYDSDFFGDKARWTVDFNAEMKDFSKTALPTACEFQYGLHFNWSWTEKTLKEDELRRYLDYAVIWRILTVDNVDEVIEKVKGSLNQKADVVVQFAIADDVLRRLISITVSSPNDVLGAKAMAKAMPYMDDYEARYSPILRELCYSPLWSSYFSNDSDEIAVFPSRAANQVEKLTQLKHQRELAARERGLMPGRPAYQDIYTFAGQIFYNGRTADDYSGIHRDWLKFVRGLTSLQAAVNPDQCAPFNAIEDVFKLMSPFFGQVLFVRAAGAYLLDLAAANEDLIKQIDRSCTISFKGGDVYTFSASV